MIGESRVALQAMVNRPYIFSPGKEIVSMRKSSGFTLMEMLTVIGIMAVMATIAIPNFISWLPKYRLGSATRDILSAMQHARLVAVKKNINVWVHFDLRNNQILMFPDYDNDENQDPDEPTLREDSLPSGIRLAEVKFGADDAFCFNSRGLASGSGGTIRIANTRSMTTRIRVNRTGNSRILGQHDK